VKIVLDTNVVVSGVFFGGVPGRILSAWSAGKLALVLSPSILEEYRRVGNELGRHQADVSETFELAGHRCGHATPIRRPVSRC